VTHWDDPHGLRLDERNLPHDEVGNKSCKDFDDQVGVDHTTSDSGRRAFADVEWN
jgi:hypothetical protein